MASKGRITVYGATGHTGRFVVAELARRGWTPVAAARDVNRLTIFEGLDQRVAMVDEPSSLDRALAGSVAVINCAGPFARTAGPLIEAAFRARIPYLDVAAEIEANLDTFANFPDRAREASVTIVPAIGFFGGLGDLLATAAIDDWPNAERISIAYGLASWRPTKGTREAGRVSRERRNGRRIFFVDGKIDFRDGPAPLVDWSFPAPLGIREAVGEFTMADTVTIARHIDVAQIDSYMNLAAVTDILNPDLPPPTVDASGRSDQEFVVEVVVHREGMERRAIARGRDIYAFTAPLVVEAAERILSNPAPPPGVFSAGEMFPARDFLESLSPAYLQINYRQGTLDDDATGRAG